MNSEVYTFFNAKEGISRREKTRIHIASTSIENLGIKNVDIFAWNDIIMHGSQFIMLAYIFIYIGGSLERKTPLLLLLSTAR